MSKRITVALNSNRTARTVFVLSTAQAKEARPIIEKVAQTKLRIKYKKGVPLRIFLASTGVELLTSDGLAQLPNDALILVSAGEEYIGKPVSGANNPPPNHFTTVNLAVQAQVEIDALFQFDAAARSLPGIIHTVAQPDLHPGNRFPIGAVFVSKGYIHPALIGGDIGCGMAWYRLNIDANHGKRIAERLRGLEGPWMGVEERRRWLGRREEDEDLYFEDNRSLGTIGAGNHFAEVQVVGPVSDPSCPLQENEVVLLVHSGSRGYGGDILKRHSTSGELSSPEASEKATSYLKEHDRACDWAVANRDLIAFRFLACLESGHPDWRLPESLEAVSVARERVLARKIVDIRHNNMERVAWSATEGEYAWIHRKGAAPTHDSVTHHLLPILPLPGSRATPTAVLRPLPNPAINNAFSVAHGAGRAMTRTKALQSLPGKYKHDHKGMLNGGSGQGGTWVVCEDKDLVWEEAPDAYKDVKAVAADLENHGLVEVLGWCEPKVSYKVRFA